MPAPLGAPAGTRLLLAFDDGSTDKEERALQLAVSEDGYRFDRLAVLTPQLPTSFADTSVSLSYDPLTKEFVALGREDGEATVLRFQCLSLLFTAFLAFHRLSLRFHCLLLA